nr:MAG TPA: hypothetical protein [Caudoviricetes sp.]
MRREELDITLNFLTPASLYTLTYVVSSEANKLLIISSGV